MDLLSLADRVERLQGPCRETDALIFKAIGAPVPFQFASKMIALSWDEDDGCYFAPFGDMRVRYECPAYTASLDVAASLIPANAMRRSGDSAIGLMGTYFCDVLREDGGDFHSLAYSEPCAIVAAALRSRAQEGV